MSTPFKSLIEVQICKKLIPGVTLYSDWETVQEWLSYDNEGASREAMAHLRWIQANPSQHNNPEGIRLLVNCTVVHQERIGHQTLELPPAILNVKQLLLANQNTSQYE